MNLYELEGNLLQVVELANSVKLNIALQHGMETVGKEKIKDINLSIWIQNNQPSVSVTNDKLIPDTFTEIEKKLNGH
ncbi:MAG: siphovirus Gp157 family protein [Levilactobacillus brevis]